MKYQICYANGTRTTIESELSRDELMRQAIPLLDVIYIEEPHASKEQAAIETDGGSSEQPKAVEIEGNPAISGEGVPI